MVNTANAIIQTLNIPALKRIMSKDARGARDHIIDFVFKHAGVSPQIFTGWIQESYDPIVWEKAMLWTGKDSLTEAIGRSTSAIFWAKTDESSTVRGKENGVRYKHVDWLSVLKCDQQWWLNVARFPRAGGVHPTAFKEHVEQSFREIYEVCVGWLISDFSFHTLLRIYEISTKYSVKEVVKCTGLVPDYNKRNIDYLNQVLDNEQAVAAALLRDQQQLTATSKRVLDMFLDIYKTGRGPIDWQEIENRIKQHPEIQDELDKVKPT